MRQPIGRRAVGEEVQVLQGLGQFQHVLGTAGVHEHGTPERFIKAGGGIGS